jgi:type I restriction enzyme S subunit
MSEESSLPRGWIRATIGNLVAGAGVFCDGDWVESEDQDPTGDVRLIQLADVGDGEYRDRSSRFLTSEKARKLSCTFLEKGDVLIARNGNSPAHSWRRVMC